MPSPRENPPDSERPEIVDALGALSEVEERSLPVRYARMWLLEAQACTNSENEIQYLRKAEHELGGAVLASGAPPSDLCLALQMTMRALREATD